MPAGRAGISNHRVNNVIIQKIQRLLGKKQSNGLPEIQGKKSSVGEKGFSLIEVLVGVALVGIAVLSLAQLFIYSILSNARADQISTASFLAQQQIEEVRNLTADELNTLTAAPIDEQIDINADSTIDYRRITEVQTSGLTWQVRVLVFTGTMIHRGTTELLQNPVQNKAKIDVSTIISR